jgi:hypothetical protein
MARNRSVSLENPNDSLRRLESRIIKTRLIFRGTPAQKQTFLSA